MLCLLSHRNIIERFILSLDLQKIYSLAENLTEGFIHPDNHLSANVVCEFLSSCKNVPPGGKA